MVSLHNLIRFLDTDFTRHIKSAVNYDVLSFENTDTVDLTVNDTEYTVWQVCLLNKEDNIVYIYFNTVQNKYHKYKLSDINTIT